jgi:uncharacterized protein (TIGR02145 family)
MKNRIRISGVLLFILTVFLVHSCEKERVPTLTTSTIINITGTTATSGGTITSEGSSQVTVRGICWSTGTTPTLADNLTSDSAGSGSFPSNLTGLTSNTTYNVRAYAINSAGKGYGNELTFNTRETVTDIDGNVYNTDLIGTQVWMVENLKTTKYNDGTAIPNITVEAPVGEAWSGLTTGAYCDYDNNPANSTTYGRLYNWFAVDNNAATKVASNGGKNVCPTGWHVPTDIDWITLTTNLGGVSVAGGKLKETGTTHWLSPNTGATNEVGFIALPGGYRNYGGNFNYIGTYGFWWSATEYNATSAWSRYMIYYYSYVSSYNYYKKNGFSVRCVRDF